MKKKYRIKKNEEFQKIISNKRFISNNTYVIYYIEKSLKHSRIGISVSKKMGIAVERNLYKRQLRMILQELFDFNSFEYDLIIIARNNFKINSYDNNKKMLENLIKKVKIKRVI